MAELTISNSRDRPARQTDDCFQAMYL